LRDSADQLRKHCNQQRQFVRHRAQWSHKSSFGFDRDRRGLARRTVPKKAAARSDKDEHQTGGEKSPQRPSSLDFHNELSDDSGGITITGDPSFRRAVLRGDIPPPVSSKPSSTNEQNIRTELLHQIEAAHKEVEGQLRALRDANPDSDAAKQGQDKLRQLNALRDQLVGGAKGMPSAALRASITSAVAESRAFSSVTSTSGTVQNQTAQLLSMSAYQQAMAEWDRKIAQSYVVESKHLAYAHDIAARYGVDISGYEQERLALESERDGARRKGDKLGERKADALIAQNTVNTLTGESDAITDPVERKKHLTELHDMQRIAEERRAALEAQIELEARRTAALRKLSPAETTSYVAQFKAEQLAEFDSQKIKLKGSAQTEAARVEWKAILLAETPGDVARDAPMQKAHPRSRWRPIPRPTRKCRTLPPRRAQTPLPPILTDAIAVWRTLALPRLPRIGRSPSFPAVHAPSSAV
jgi:hypothetical protein